MFIVFLILKLVHVITWLWRVTEPLWIDAAVALTLLLVCIGMVGPPGIFRGTFTAFTQGRFWLTSRRRSPRPRRNPCLNGDSN